MRTRQRLSRPVLESLEERLLLSGGFGLVNLASDVPGLARVLQPNLVNPWGLAFSPTGPFWLADNGAGVSTVLDGRGGPFALVVQVASAWDGATPTGTVFNSSAGFVIAANGVSAPSRFLFAGADGTISGWDPVVDPTRVLRVVDNSSSGAVYTGLALATGPAGAEFLYAADFSQATIAVFDQDFNPVIPGGPELRPGVFQDPNLPAGYAPFNIQNIGNLLFVTYARQGPTRSDDAPGAGHGFIDVYDPAGDLLGRFASQGTLDSPWGLALAPADFGRFGGALLVGNNGDGRISAFDPTTGDFLGQLANDSGTALSIPNLWALTFGNGHVAGDPNTLFFTAGVDNEQHGLFGAIQAPGRRGADTGGAAAFDPNAPGEPADYPLPPRTGPAFQDSTPGPAPSADLVPLRPSSLILVPTFSLPVQPLQGSGARDQGSGGPTSLTPDPWPLTPGGASPAAGLLLLLSAAGSSHPALGAQKESSAGNLFAEWNASYLDSGGALAPDLLARISFPTPEAPWIEEEQGRGALPVGGQEYEVLTAVSAEERAVLLAQGASREHGATWPGGAWTSSIPVFLVLSLPVVWAWRLQDRKRGRLPGAGNP